MPLSRYGALGNKVAVVEVRKATNEWAKGFDNRSLALLAGIFQEKGFNFEGVSTYSLTYQNAEEQRKGLEELKDALKGTEYLITLGATAMHSFIPESKKSTLESYRGSTVWSSETNCWVIPTEHPSVVYVGPRETINSRFDKFDFLYDHVNKVISIIRGELSAPDRDEQETPCESIFIGHGEDDNREGRYLEYYEATTKEVSTASVTVKNWLQEASNKHTPMNPLVMSLDTESRGLKVRQEDAFIMLQIYDGKKAVAFNSGVVYKNAGLFRKLLNNPNIRWVLHNTKYDRKVLKHSLKVDLGKRDVDTLALALGVTEKGKQVGLKYLSRLYLNAPFYEESLEKYMGSDKSQWDFSKIPPVVLAEYGNRDVYYTYHLFKILLDKVKKEKTGKAVSKLIMPSQRMFADMEYQGIRYDSEGSKKTAEQWAPKIEESKRKVQEYAAKKGFPQNDTAKKSLSTKEVCDCVPVMGTYLLAEAKVTSYRKILRENNISVGDCSECDNKRYTTKVTKRLNVNSPSQMQHFCFDILKMKELPGEGRTTKKDFWKLNANHEFAEMMAEFKEQMFLKHNFLDSLPEKVDNRGYLSPNFLVFGTKTGRLSVQEPAVQTIPKHGANATEVRKNILPDPGHYLVDVDYKSLEMYVAHHLTKDPVLLEILQGEWDAHTALAARIYGKKPEDVTKEERQSVKPVNFGAGYGISGFKLALNPDMEKVTGGDPDKAQEFLDEFWNMYSVWHSHTEDWKEQALEHQFLTTELGRKRRWNLVTPLNHGKVKNQAMNFKGQSVASDLCLSSAIKLHDYFTSNPANGRILFPVHDSLVFSIPKDRVHKVVRRITSEMTTPPFETDTPFGVSVEIGLNYGETIEYDPKYPYADNFERFPGA